MHRALKLKGIVPLSLQQKAHLYKSYSLLSSSFPITRFWRENDTVIPSSCVFTTTFQVQLARNIWRNSLRGPKARVHSGTPTCRVWAPRTKVQHAQQCCRSVHSKHDPDGRGKRLRKQEQKEARRKEMVERQRRNEKSQKTKAQVTYDIATPPGEKKVTSVPLPAAYNPQYVEAAWYAWWERQGFFKPKDNAEPGESFVVCLPPPNVTGSLHLGHTLGSTIQDALIRWHRMHGRRSLWVPGCDHAGIATQVVVEKQLWREQQKSRHDIGRKKFVEEVWKWKQQKGDTIYEQMKRLGCSLDWSREVFTLDPKMNHAVNEAFIRLHDEGLIYRDTRLVNWSCSLKSSISDIEVENHPLEKKTYMSVPGYDSKVMFGVMTSFAYPVEGCDEELVVSTTRLETMLGDTAVAVHPEDPRYQHLHGKHLHHPLCDRIIPVVTDEAVDPHFGTGAVKITPAHDHNDYEMGQRHQLPSITVMDDNGCMANVPEQFKGMKRFDARKAVLQALTEQGLIKETVDHAMTIPVCSRSGDVVEPMLKEQWHMDCSEMANRAVQAVEEGRLELIPDGYIGMWNEWLGNIRDWCISRQLWWGHQIPAYHAVNKSDESGKSVWVSAHNLDEALQKACLQLGCSPDQVQLSQDEDVLDTWFSSGLFPFSCFGWPNMDGDYEKFYPISLMETAGDILFFWVARMVMLGEKLTGKLPFDKVLLHGLVRDSHGRKMSKSLGNVLDPMDIIHGISLQDLQAKLSDSNLSVAEIKKAQDGQRKDYPLGIAQCGADALRFTLCSYQYKAHVLNVNVTHIKSYHNFCNKIWQAFKFCHSHWTQKEYPELEERRVLQGTATDVWILSRLSHLVHSCDTAFKQLSLNQATQALHQFWQQEFCDVYVEYAKGVFKSDDQTRRQLVEQITYECVSTMLRCLSPFMPYLTEELYQRLPGQLAESVCITDYPSPSQYPWRSELLEDDMTMVQEVVTELLAFRHDIGLSKEKPKVWLETCDPCLYEALLQHPEVLCTLSRCGDIQVTMEPYGDEPIKQAFNKDNCVEVDLSDTCTAFVELEGLVDIDQTLTLLDKQLASLEGEHEKFLKESDSELQNEDDTKKDGDK